MMPGHTPDPAKLHTGASVWFSRETETLPGEIVQINADGIANIMLLNPPVVPLQIGIPPWWQPPVILSPPYDLGGTPGTWRFAF